MAFFFLSAKLPQTLFQLRILSQYCLECIVILPCLKFNQRNILKLVINPVSGSSALGVALEQVQWQEPFLRAKL